MYILCKHAESHFTKSNSLFVQTYLANKTWFWFWAQGSFRKKARENATLVVLASNRLKQPTVCSMQLLIVMYFCAFSKNSSLTHARLDVRCVTHPSI